MPTMTTFPNASSGAAAAELHDEDRCKVIVADLLERKTHEYEHDDDDDDDEKYEHDEDDDEHDESYTGSNICGGRRVPRGRPGRNVQGQK